jgi:hypothetical protein
VPHLKVGGCIRFDVAEICGLARPEPRRHPARACCAGPPYHGE